MCSQSLFIKEFVLTDEFCLMQTLKITLYTKMCFILMTVYTIHLNLLEYIYRRLNNNEHNFISLDVRMLFIVQFIAHKLLLLHNITNAELDPVV